MKTVLGAVLTLGLLASPAMAQSSYGTWNDLPDRFQIDTGYFRLSPTTKLRLNSGAGPGGEIELERDLGFDDVANTFWVDGTWRLGRRHQIKLASGSDTEPLRHEQWHPEARSRVLRAGEQTLVLQRGVAAGGLARLLPPEHREGSPRLLRRDLPHPRGRPAAPGGALYRSHRRTLTDLELLRKLESSDIPVVSVFLTGRPLWVNPEINASSAFVVAWLPGSEGNGVAEVLFWKADGSVNHDFQGRLSLAFSDVRLVPGDDGPPVCPEP